jgi:hypothetical protein
MRLIIRPSPFQTSEHPIISKQSISKHRDVQTMSCPNAVDTTVVAIVQPILCSKSAIIQHRDTFDFPDTPPKRSVH